MRVVVSPPGMHPDQRFLQAKAERMKSRGERVDLWD